MKAITVNPPTNKQGSLKGKLLNYTISIVLIMAILSTLSMSILIVYRSRIDEMFQRNLALNEIGDQLDMVDSELISYLSTKGSNALNNYMFHEDKLRTNSLEVAETVVAYSEEELLILDINSMTRSYLNTANAAVQERRRSNVKAYTELYEEASVIKGYIKGYIDELNIRQLDSNADTYVLMTQRIRMISWLNFVLILDLLLLSIFIVMNMSNALVGPIVRLSHSAEEIAKGHFESKEIIVETNDEVEILAKAFNKMKRSIHAYIEELKEKAFTEALLKDQEMENLKMQALLDNARLYALQSQMNPHFLFNTINAAVQLSMIEGADRTSEFLETMSRLFRYNIKQLDAAVTIGHEVANSKDYYELLKVRFGELIQFVFQVDAEILDSKIPPLILQPIVENAYIHGLSKKETGGFIKISGEMIDGEVHIKIRDNGVGMTKERILEIFGRVHHSYVADDSGESNGIGMANVIERLELYYKKADVVNIESVVGEGTCVHLMLPYIKGVLHD